MGQKHSGSVDITTGPGTYRPKTEVDSEKTEGTRDTNLAGPASSGEFQTGDSGYEGDKERRRSSSDSDGSNDRKIPKQKKKVEYGKVSGQNIDIKETGKENRGLTPGHEHGGKKAEKKSEPADFRKEKEEHENSKQELEERTENSNHSKQEEEKKITEHLTLQPEHEKKKKPKKDANHSGKKMKDMEQKEVHKKKYSRVKKKKNDPTLEHSSETEDDNYHVRQTDKKTKPKKRTKAKKTEKNEEVHIDEDTSLVKDENCQKKPEKKNETSCCGKKKLAKVGSQDQSSQKKVCTEQKKTEKKSETSCCSKRNKTEDSDDEILECDRKEQAVKESKKRLNLKKTKPAKTESTDPIVVKEEFELNQMPEVQPEKKKKPASSKKQRAKDEKSNEVYSSPELSKHSPARSSLHREKKCHSGYNKGCSKSSDEKKGDLKDIESVEETYIVQEESIVRTEATVMKPDFRFDDFSSHSSPSSCDSECEGDCQLHFKPKKTTQKPMKKGSAKKMSAKSFGHDQFREYVCHMDDMNDGEMREFALKRGKKILLVREHGHFYALSAVCPNDHTRLVDGVLHQGRIRCCQDAACFSIQTGRIEDFPGLNSIHKFEVEVECSHVNVRGYIMDLNTVSPTPPTVAHDPKIDKTKVLILGDGPGGVKCAETLREEGFRGEITIACGYLRGPFDHSKLPDVITTHKMDACSLRSKDCFTSKDIDLIPDMKVFEIDSDKRHVIFVDGHCCKYDFLVIATPPTCRRLKDVEGVETRGILYLNSPDDALTIAKDARSKHVVIVGSTLQVLLDWVNKGGDGHMAIRCLRAEEQGDPGRCVEKKTGAEKLPGRFWAYVWRRVSRTQDKFQLPREMAKLFKAHHVKIHAEVNLVKFHAVKGRLHEVELSNGEKLLCDVCVVALGHEPTETYKNCGLTVSPDFHIVTDQETRTSKSGIFALGGNARCPVRYSHYSLQYMDNQVKMEYAQGHTAALAILSRTHEVHHVVPFYSTHLFDKLLSCAGMSHDHDDVIIHDLDMEGTPGKRNKVPNMKFVAFYIKNGRVCAILGMNCGVIVAQAAELFSFGRTINGDEVRRSALSWTHKLHHAYNATNGVI